MAHHNLIERTFGWLKVEERVVRTAPSGKTRIVWKSRCKCGKIVYPSTHDLLSGGRRRCSVKCMGRPARQEEDDTMTTVESPGQPVTPRMTIPRRATYLDKGDVVCRVCGCRFRPTEGWLYIYRSINYCSWACAYKARDALQLRKTREDRRRKKTV